VIFINKIKNIMATTKITMNELRNIVKKLVKEETMLNEDNLELKSISKQLYTFLKELGVNAKLVAQTPSQTNGTKNIGSNLTDEKNEALIWYWDDLLTKQTQIEIHLRGWSKAILGVEKKILSNFNNLEQYMRDYHPERLSFRLKEKTTVKGGLVGNTQTNQGQQQPVSEGVNKITMNELRNIVKKLVKEETILKENEQEELFLAKKYVDDMIDRYGDYKTIRKNILGNLVNSEYGKTSNSFVTKVWDEFNKKFPS
jgi:hypothetical protein